MLLVYLKQDGWRLSCYLQGHFISCRIRHPETRQADKLQVWEILPEEVQRPAVCSDDNFMLLLKEMPDNRYTASGMTNAPVERAE